MNYKNAYIYTKDFKFTLGGFSIESGKFSDVLLEKEDAVDLNGAYVIPGLIDIHTQAILFKPKVTVNQVAGRWHEILWRL